MKTALYRHFNADGALLYVGISSNPLKRLDAHVKGSSWVQEIETVSLLWFDSREEASDAEREAISSEGPLHNIQCARGGDTPVAELISCWPTRLDLAQAIGGNVESVHKWAKTGRIPSRWHMKVILAAKERGLKGIDADWMVNVHSHDFTPSAGSV